MKEQINKILKMMEEGKIDSEKASELIAAIKEKEETAVKVIPQNYSEKMLKIRVLDKEDKVNVTVPIKFLKAIGGAIDKIPGVKAEGVDVKMIMEAIDNGVEGKIVDVQSSNGDIVEVSIE